MPDKITDIFIKNLEPDSKEYTRREKGGFGIRVHPSGRKNFFYLYRVDGQRRFLNLGDYPATKLKDARDLYEEARVKVKALKAGRTDGLDPVENIKEKRNEREERCKAPTVSDLIEEYIERHAKRFKKSWPEDDRLLRKEILPHWGIRKAADITKRDVTLLLENIVDRGTPAMSNQVLKITRKMFNFAVERDILQHTPFTAGKALAPNIRRERTLTEAEIKSLWCSLGNAVMSDEIRRALKLVLVTGQRPGEVAGMRATEIHGHWWTIPSNRAKNGRDHQVYLTDTALDMIGDLTGKDFIFPTPHKNKNQAIASHALPSSVRRNLAWPITDAKRHHLYDKAGKQATENRLKIDPFTPHDLRRTAATFMASMGFMDEIIDAVLNHVKTGVIRTYNRHGYGKEKQLALESWERKLIAILSGTESNVVPLRRNANS